MEFGSATVLVSIEVAVFIQIGERGWIGHPFVEVTDFLAAVHFGAPSDVGRALTNASKPKFALY